MVITLIYMTKLLSFLPYICSVSYVLLRHVCSTTAVMDDCYFVLSCINIHRLVLCVAFCIFHVFCAAALGSYTCTWVLLHISPAILTVKMVTQQSTAVVFNSLFLLKFSHYLPVMSSSSPIFACIFWIRIL